MNLADMNRRGFLAGATGFLMAPALVRASSIMPVSAIPAMQGTENITYTLWIRIGCEDGFTDWKQVKPLQEN